MLYSADFSGRLHNLMRGNTLFKFLDSLLGIPFVRILSFFGRRTHGSPSAKEFHRILVVKFAGIGDAVLLIPAVRALRNRFPRAEITLLGTSLTVPHLQQFPEYVDRTIVLQISRLLNPTYLMGTIRHLRSLKCDLAIDFEQWARIVPVLLRLAGIPHRVGFRTREQRRHAAFTQWADHRADVHEAENFLALAKLVGVREWSTSLEPRVDANALERVRHSLRESGWNGETRLLVLHPGCGAHGFPREWPPEFYSDLVNRLSKEQKLFAVITGTAQERSVMEATQERISFPSSTYFISDLVNWTALLSLSSLVVSGNNGAMHLAASLNVPQVALHGPTDPKRWGPLNPRAVIVQSSCPECPCLNLGFEYHRADGFCMRQISVEDVYRRCVVALARG
jgi:heptosyltransferase-3